LMALLWGAGVAFCRFALRTQITPALSNQVVHSWQRSRTCTRLMALCALTATCGLLGVWLGAVAGMLDGMWNLTWAKVCITLWTALGTGLLYTLGACREVVHYGLLGWVSVPCVFVAVAAGPFSQNSTVMDFVVRHHTTIVCLSMHDFCACGRVLRTVLRQSSQPSWSLRHRLSFSPIESPPIAWN
jgi:hypothetical protein